MAKDRTDPVNRSKGGSIPAKPNSKAFGRSVADFRPLLAAEKILLKRARFGASADISDHVPDKPIRGKMVRAEFIRFLVLGGDESASVHEKGIHLRGAWITGQLDLGFCNVVRTLSLFKCRLDQKIVILGAQLQSINLSGSAINGIMGNGAIIKGSLYLRDGFVSNSECTLTEIQIEGNLYCRAATFISKEGPALALDRSRISGSVFFNAGFLAQGQVRLLGARVGGNVECHAGTFRNRGAVALACDRLALTGNLNLHRGFRADGEVCLAGARIGGEVVFANAQVRNPKGFAIFGDRIEIYGSLFFTEGFCAFGEVRLELADISGSLICNDSAFRNSKGTALSLKGTVVAGELTYVAMRSVRGVTSLANMRAGALSDTPDDWRRLLRLDGFRYDRIVGAPTDAATRIEWLRKQSPLGAKPLFWPQPWEHLTRTLRDMGHAEDARLVAMEKQREMRRVGAIGNRTARPREPGALARLDRARVWIVNRIERMLHYIYGALAGYGYRPLRTFVLMASFWLLAAGIFWAAEERGLFVPSTPSLLTDEAFRACGPREVGAIRWTRCPNLPRDYTTFDPLMYSLDVILPLVDLKQEGDWEPLVKRGPGWQMWDGLLVRGIMWAEILFGWIGSLLLVSAVGRLVQKD